MTQAKEAVVVDPPESPGSDSLAVVSRESGVMEIAFMSDADFGARLMALKQGQDRIRLMQKELMVEDEDYGVIPGTKKPTLLKPGAEKLCNIYGLVPTYEETWTQGDGIITPTLRCHMTAFIHRGDADGPIVGVGKGAANSFERKHRYRGAQRSCPVCGCEGTIRRSRWERDGDKGWYCHDKAGGCGEQFFSKDPRIVEQQAGMVENRDPYDVENTLIKMAKKRAQIDGTLSATATSGLFSQDLEDLGGGGGHDAGGAAPGDAPREPGSDDDVASMVDTTEGPVRVGSGQHAAAAGAEPNPTYDPNARPEPRRAPGPGPKVETAPPCPKCGGARTVIKSKFDGPTWYCLPARGGCKAKFDTPDQQELPR